MSSPPDVVVHVGPEREQARACLAALRRHAGDSRIVVVDDDLVSGQADGAWQAAVEGLEVLDGMGAGRAAGFNLGVAACESEHVCVVSAEVVVSAGWLKLLGEALVSDPRVACAGPVAGGLYGQSVATSYAGLEDFELFSSAYNHSDPAKWSRVLRLSDACLLMRREAFDAAGGFDENYTFGLFADDDLSLRLVTSGRSLLRCGNVLVHYAGAPPLPPDQARFVEMERQGLEARWGFSPNYSMLPRGEVVNLVPGREPLRVLDLGCACGATLLEIANRHPGSTLYGVEMNEHAAAVASSFAEVITGDAESPLPYPDESFDCVICADVLEHLRDPWQVLGRIRRLLAPGGSVVASIPNIMHVSVLNRLLRGRFTYEDAGILDRTHLRFFTLNEIDDMFRDAGFVTRRFSATMVPVSESEQQVAEALATGFSMPRDLYLVYQYLVVATA